jgi:hypothetical protein
MRCTVSDHHNYGASVAQVVGPAHLKPAQTTVTKSRVALHCAAQSTSRSIGNTARQRWRVVLFSPEDRLA